MYVETCFARYRTIVREGRKTWAAKNLAMWTFCVLNSEIEIIEHSDPSGSEENSIESEREDESQGEIEENESSEENIRNNHFPEEEKTIE